MSDKLKNIKFFGVNNNELYMECENPTIKIDCYGEPLILFIDSNVINIFNDFKLTEEDLPGLVFCGVIEHYKSNFNTIRNNEKHIENILKDIETSFQNTKKNEIIESEYKKIKNSKAEKAELNRFTLNFFNKYQNFEQKGLESFIDEILSKISNIYINFNGLYFFDILKRFESEMNECIGDNEYPLNIRDSILIKSLLNKNQENKKFPLKNEDGSQNLKYDFSSNFLIKKINILIFKKLKNAGEICDFNFFEDFEKWFNQKIALDIHLIQSYLLFLYNQLQENNDILKIRENSKNGQGGHLKNFYPLKNDLNFNSKELKSSFNDIVFFTYTMYLSCEFKEEFNISFLSQDADAVILFNILKKMDNGVNAINNNIKDFSSQKEKLSKNIVKDCLTHDNLSELIGEFENILFARVKKTKI